MTSQDHATAALLAWQSLRELTPELRIEAMMADFFLSEEDRQFEQVMRCVTRQMEDV